MSNEEKEIKQGESEDTTKRKKEKSNSTVVGTCMAVGTTVGGFIGYLAIGMTIGLGVGVVIGAAIVAIKEKN